MIQRNTLCIIPTIPSFNSDHRIISSSSLHPQIRKRIRPHRHSSSILIHTTPFIHMQALQDRNSTRRWTPLQLPHSPSTITIHSQIPSYSRWNHIQRIPSQSTLSSPFPSTSIHQCILIKSIIHFPPPLRLQSTPPFPHSIHSTQNSSLLLEFKSIHFTHHLWQSQTTPSIPHSTTPFNHLNPTK